MIANIIWTKTTALDRAANTSLSGNLVIGLRSTIGLKIFDWVTGLGDGVEEGHAKIGASAVLRSTIVVALAAVHCSQLDQDTAIWALLVVGGAIYAVKSSSLAAETRNITSLTIWTVSLDSQEWSADVAHWWALTISKVVTSLAGETVDSGTAGATGTTSKWTGQALVVAVISCTELVEVGSIKALGNSGSSLVQNAFKLSCEDIPTNTSVAQNGRSWVHWIVEFAALAFWRTILALVLSLIIRVESNKRTSSTLDVLTKSCN